MHRCISLQLWVHNCLNHRVKAKENEKEGTDVAGENPLAEGKDDTKPEAPKPPEAPSLSFFFVTALTGLRWGQSGTWNLGTTVFLFGAGAMVEKLLDPLALTACLCQHGGTSGRTLYLRFLP